MKILLDCERMKFPQTGLYYFCLKLGLALQQQVKNDKLVFYTPPSVKNIFGPAEYIRQHSIDKFKLPAVPKLDIWHCTFQGSSYFPFRKKMRKVFTIHDINFMSDDNITATKKNKYLALLEKKIKASDHVAAISQFTLDEVKKFIDIGNTPASVVYNGCNIDPLLKIEKPVQAPQKKFLFTIGTIVEKKNMHVLPALLNNNDFDLVIAGITLSEDYKQRVVDEAVKWKVKDRVHFTGGINEKEKYWYLQHCEAFLFPSLAEGFGLPVVEAMYFGKPLILSRLSSLPEIGGELAYYFDDFEPASMQRILQNSLRHYHTHHPSASITARADLFSWQSAAEQYLRIYHSLV